MALVFAAISPHPPLLIPTIGGKLLKKVEKTKHSLHRLEEELYLAKPDLILIISPHGVFLPSAFSLNIAHEYFTDLREFGDLTTKLTFKGASDFAGLIWQEARNLSLPVTTTTEPALDHGTTVPLYYLLPHLPNIPIMPIGFCDLDAKSHLDFGFALREVIQNTNKRVAVIASADLSHALKTDAPAGFSPRAAEFDETINRLLETRNTAGIVNLDRDLVEEGAECGLRSILIVLGILRDSKYDFETYSYEAPFGVGYLTANFLL